MSFSPDQTLLERIHEKVNVDVDTLDSDFIRSLPVIPYDQTSNPIWLFVQLQNLSAKELATQILRSDNDLRESKDGLLFLSKLAIAYCKRNIPLIKGRVLVQTTPAGAYSIQATLNHARMYVKEFERSGISKDRYCIKIMATGPGVVAAKILAQEGIPILGTGVFSIEQAVACFQAGCLYISPYFNGINELQDPSLLPTIEDPALDHPFSKRLVQMVQAYKELHQKTGKQPPLIKNAGFASYREVIASAEIGCHSVTLSIPTLEEMLKSELSATPLPTHLPTKLDYLRRPYAETVPIPSRRLVEHLGPMQQASTSSKQQTPDINKDYLAADGKILDAAIEADEIARVRIQDAIALFKVVEEGSFQFARDVLKDSSNVSSNL